MAEFQKVIKDIKRMCKAHECEDCPIRDVMDMADGSCPFCEKKVDWAVIEQEAAFWAKEHPEPRGPSWHEAWKQLFPNGQGSPCPATYDMQYEPDECGKIGCAECKNRPMSAEVAEKLGVKQIGGENNE